MWYCLGPGVLGTVWATLVMLGKGIFRDCPQQCSGTHAILGMAPTLGFKAYAGTPSCLPGSLLCPCRTGEPLSTSSRRGVCPKSEFSRLQCCNAF